MTTSLLGRRQGLLLAGADAGGGAPASPLLTDLVSYWKLDEASGNAIDAHGTNHLTDNNTVTTAAGKQGTARQFTAANSESLSIVDNASLSTGDIDFTLAGWVRFDGATNPAVMMIAGKWGSGQNEYILYLINGDLVAEFSADGSAATTLAIASGLVIDTWYFVVLWHNRVANTVNAQVDNGVVASVAHASGVFDGSAAFALGIYSGSSSYLNGKLDEVGFWKKVLSAAERSALYGGGSGTTYPTFS